MRAALAWLSPLLLLRHAVGTSREAGYGLPSMATREGIGRVATGDVEDNQHTAEVEKLWSELAQLQRSHQQIQRSYRQLADDHTKLQQDHLQLAADSAHDVQELQQDQLHLRQSHDKLKRDYVALRQRYYNMVATSAATNKEYERWQRATNSKLQSFVTGRRLRAAASSKRRRLSSDQCADPFAPQLLVEGACSCTNGMLVHGRNVTRELDSLWAAVTAPTANSSEASGTSTLSSTSAPATVNANRSCSDTNTTGYNGTTTNVTTTIWNGDIIPPDNIVCESGNHFAKQNVTWVCEDEGGVAYPSTSLCFYRGVHCFEDILGGGWTLVRRVKPGSSWHPAQDSLSGTAEYGDWQNNGTVYATFSRAFSDKIGPETQFLFATGDCVHWLVAAKETVLDATGDPFDAEILSSSDNSNPHTVSWINRPHFSEDPWISLADHDDSVAAGTLLYGENSFTNSQHAQSLLYNNGANVFVRNHTAPCRVSRYI